MTSSMYRKTISTKKDCSFSDWPNLLLSYVQITGVSAQIPSHEYGFIGINNSQTVGYNVKEGKLYF